MSYELVLRKNPAICKWESQKDFLNSNDLVYMGYKKKTMKYYEN
jgi:hypothetical protein